jgi:hypothetical protein
MGIPKEDALKMSALEVKELLLVHEFMMKAEKARVERDSRKQEALLGQK